MVLHLQNIIEAEVVTVNNFQWSTEGDDDQVLHDMAAYLQVNAAHPLISAIAMHVCNDIGSISGRIVW